MDAGPNRRHTWPRRAATSIGIAALVVVATPAARAQESERGVVTIYVTDTRDEAIDAAVLVVRGSEVETTISGHRDVKIGTQRDGTQFLRISAEGYRPAAFSIHLPDDRPYELHVQLESVGKNPPTGLRPRRVWMMPVGQGPTRLLLGEGEVADDSLLAVWHARTFADLMRRMLGVDARPQNGHTVPLGRPSKAGPLCSMSLFLDGNHAVPLTALEGVYTEEAFELIEVFRFGSGMPSAYRRGGSQCGALIFWTKQRV